MIASGPRNAKGDLVKSGFDVGRVAIGQGGAEGELQATTTQMAEVAATIANGGTLMEPTFLQEAKDPDGRVIEELDPDEQNEVVSEETAAQVTEMMVNVANEGPLPGSRPRWASSPARRVPPRSTSRRRSTAHGSSASRRPRTRRSLWRR